MKKLTFSALSVVLVLLCSCKSPSAGSANPADDLTFSKLIYHLSKCNGTCPSMDLQIDNNKNVYVNREFYRTKSTIDSVNSGRFKGTLSQGQYNKLIEVLKKSKLDSLEFTPVGITDVSETTLIVYYNGKRKYLHSARPAPAAEELINFIKSVGNDRSLERTTEVKELEN
ncbi:DUF6438 domain-containing protein [Longitalea luteola]|uniref:DUF6438 domain-containing protein n=1 Tax=Longitalea luteola TaxID=2812563 RepID=UPI001A965B2B|nr:DUF6438 domain-containing protein [Longitalea luteola]